MRLRVLLLLFFSCDQQRSILLGWYFSLEHLSVPGDSLSQYRYEKWYGTNHILVYLLLVGR